MYDELVKSLRDCAEVNSLSLYKRGLMKQAADAIEELTGLVQEAERDRDEYRERLDKANDDIEELQKHVPKVPHGRLIDADALLKHKGDCYDADGHLLYAVGTGNILRAPTIIPASEEGET